MNTNLAKLIALAVVGGVAKALFRAPDPSFNYYYNGEPINPNPNAETEKETV